MGFKANPYDNSLFTHQEIKVAVVIYVDDLLIIGSNKEKIRDLKKRLGERFDIKDLGPATCFLGIQIERNREAGTLILHQKDYIEKLLEKFGQKDAIPISTPMEKGGIPYKEDYSLVLE